MDLPEAEQPTRPKNRHAERRRPFQRGHEAVDAFGQALVVPDTHHRPKARVRRRVGRGALQPRLGVVAVAGARCQSLAQRLARRRHEEDVDVRTFCVLLTRLRERARDTFRTIVRPAASASSSAFAGMP